MTLDGSRRSAMRVAVASACIVSAWTPVLVPAAVRAGEEIPAQFSEFERLEGMFRPMKISESDRKSNRLVFFYGHRSNDLRQIEVKDGKFRRLWKSQPLGATILDIFVEDLDADGIDEVIDYTAAGEVTVWQESAEGGYSIRWESDEQDFQSVQAMTVANADSDPALELVFCADQHIVIFDGMTFIQEKSGRDELHPTRMLVGNVDGEPGDELVTSDGNVLDLATLNVEWSTEPFGDPIYLFDIDHDGAMELIGEQSGAIKVWNLRDRRDLW